MADYTIDDLLGGEVSVGGTATYTKEYKIGDFMVEGIKVEKAYDAAGFLNYQLAATSLPKWKAQGYLQYHTGPHNLRLTVNYIHKYIDQRTSILAPNPQTGQVNTAGRRSPSPCC